MAETQVEDVVEAAQAALQEIDGTGGYHVSLKPGSVVIEPLNLLLVHESRVPLMTLEIADAGERAFQLHGQIEDRLVLALTARLNARGNAYDRKTVAFTEFEADVERAFAVDPTLGGLATDCRCRQGQMLTADSSSDLVIALVFVDIDLARAYGAPEGP